MSRPDWWTALDPLAKALAALATAIVAGATLGGWLGLPGQVSQNTQGVEKNAVAVDSVRSHIERLDSMEIPARLDRIELNSCLTLVELGVRDPRECRQRSGG